MAAIHCRSHSHSVVCLVAGCVCLNSGTLCVMVYCVLPPSPSMVAGGWGTQQGLTVDSFNSESLMEIAGHHKHDRVSPAQCMA